MKNFLSKILNYNINLKNKIIILLIAAVFVFLFIQKVKADEEATIDELEIQMMRLEMQALKLRHQIKKLQAEQVSPVCGNDEIGGVMDENDAELFEESEFDIKLPEE
jgi:uncharacterized membrane protein (DUF106 family)